MATFAERMGLRETRSLVQSNSLDSETRTGLWNILVILREIFDQQFSPYHNDSTHSDLLASLWTNHFKRPLDELPGENTTWEMVKVELLKGEWFDVLDLLEHTIKVLTRTDEQWGESNSKPFADVINDRFETYLVGYRFIANEITPVDSNAEAEAIESALEDAGSIPGARHSLERAIELLADRQNPDYPNSVKESISAVESITRKITGETTLGAGLKKLQASGLKIHPALKDGWLKLYGWASDEDGVRHGAIDAANIDQTMAKYLLVSCSAFVSYLTEEGRKVGLL